MNDVSAVLLAAGESRRMGEVNKLLLPVDGVPLVRRTAQILMASKLGELVVVLGHQAEWVAAALDGLGVAVIHNDYYQDGQMTSVYAGFEALQQECEGIMVCLSDQPLLTVQDINALIDAFLTRTGGDVLVPTYRGRRGNPRVLAGESRRSILDGGRNLGGKHFIENNPDSVSTVEWDSDHVLIDIDTPEDASRLIQDNQYDNANAR